MIKNRRIGHIGIATNDVARDVEWYVNVLGFEVTGKFQNGNDTVCFLKMMMLFCKYFHQILGFRMRFPEELIIIVLLLMILSRTMHIV